MQIEKARAIIAHHVPTADIARCSFCGKEGIYGEDIIDQDYYDEITGHDITKCSCRDLEACFACGGRTRAVY